jgi:hypothetical protein
VLWEKHNIVVRKSVRCLSPTMLFIGLTSLQHCVDTCRHNPFFPHLLQGSTGHGCCRGPMNNLFHGERPLESFSPYLHAASKLFNKTSTCFSFNKVRSNSSYRLFAFSMLTDLLSASSIWRWYSRRRRASSKRRSRHSSVHSSFSSGHARMIGGKGKVALGSRGLSLSSAESKM